MDAGLAARSLGLLLLFAAGSARADLYLCVDGGGHRLIQDRPCKTGQRTDAQVKEHGSRAAPPVTSGRSRAAAATPVIETGIRKNKTVICQLLDGEKRDTEAQLRGEQPAPAGESPKDNLVKIERQRSRVGCDAAG
ncbi:MAG: DUF4124 domain-containing protein [Stagnimonas sp.]|nr:DUF4124 domain-containing protein [Stagnimonas sp.]